MMGKLQEEFMHNDCTIFNNEDVIIAINMLKLDKAAGFDSLKAESIKFAYPMIIDVLRVLFNACCKHGCVPNGFCLGRIVPVPKKSNVCGSFGDFRPVTTVSVIAKVFEYCLVNRLSVYKRLHDLQFGFTRGGGCDKALLVFRSVVEYFNDYGSTVYVSALDLTKAYDRLNQCILVLKLYELGVPRDIVMLFLFWFRHLCAAVVWENVKSVVFYVKSGVRQGGVCSCWLFNIYVNELIIKLEESGLGCYLHGVYAGCILYADDILLLSGSLIKLQLMLDLCYSFGYDNDLTFNAKKSAFLAFGVLFEKASGVDMFIGGERINWVTECNYLGVNVCSGRKFRTNCEDRRRKFCVAANSIMSHNLLSEECFMYVLRTQCIPILTYGAGVWRCNSEALRGIGVTFNNAVRKVFHYRKFESVKDILRGFGILPMDLYIKRVRLVLLFDCLKSERNIVKLCAACNLECEDVINECEELGLFMSGVCKNEVKFAVWNSFVSIVGW
jgi:hypothetical protein